MTQEISSLDRRFERDVLPLADRLFVAALRLAGNRHDAEDLVQETMLNAYTGFHTFTDGSNPSAWLFRILRNNWITRYRKRQRRPAEVPIEQFDDRYVGPVAHGSQQSAELSALAALPDADISAAFRGLRRQYRLAVYLADVAGMSCKEIAAATDVPLGTVMSRLHRGRRQLRSSLQNRSQS